MGVNNGNNFQESFDQSEGLGPFPGPFPFSKMLQLLNNQLCQDSSVSFFEKENKLLLKMVSVNY